MGRLLAARASFGRLSLGYTRIELPTRTIDTPIDVVSGELCGYIGHFGICGNTHFLRGDVQRPDRSVSLATTVYGGVTLGYATW